MPGYDGIDRFEEMVMLAVARLGSNAYGVTIREEIERRTGRDLSYGTIYKVLDRLVQKGFVSSFLGESTRERGGRAKRYFRIEASGVRALQDEHKAMERLRTALPATNPA